MSDTQKQPVTIARLRQRIEQVQSAPLLQKQAIAIQAVSEAVDLVAQVLQIVEETQDAYIDKAEANVELVQRLHVIEDRLVGLERINGVL